MLDSILNSVVSWLSDTAINGWVQGTAWAWPTMESIHFIGLIMLIGGLLIIDLALIGVIKGLSPKDSHRLLRVVIFGFSINLITGLGFIFGDPGRYFINISFQLKMLFLLLAGLNAIWYTFKIQPKVIDMDVFTPTSATKIAGTLSLVFWFAVLCYGRLIPYLGTG